MPFQVFQKGYTPATKGKRPPRMTREDFVAGVEQLFPNKEVTFFVEKTLFHTKLHVECRIGDDAFSFVYKIKSPELDKINEEEKLDRAFKKLQGYAKFGEMSPGR